jgi:uncharacterized membrane-anchored protein
MPATDNHPGPDHKPAPGLLGPPDHPLRFALSEEMHVRIFPAMKSPERLFQLMMLTGEGGYKADRAHVDRLCKHFGKAPLLHDIKHFNADLGPFHLHWESHTEFSTYSFIQQGDFSTPFDDTILKHIPESWLKTLPGTVLRATQLAILDKKAAEPSAEELAKMFRPDDLVSCHVAQGEARIWSDFRLHDNGFGWLLVHDRGLKGGDVARLAQRLLEMGNYRKIALLGLPMAQRLTPRVSALERELTAIVARMAEGREEEDKLLNELSELSAALSQIAAETSYRISATRAYNQIVMDRMRELDETRIQGFQTLSDFTERRLAPAERTCNSFARRLEDLANRVGRASNLLRTKISNSVERQNAVLLASMNERARLQLRLQQTVEGLSVAAVSYYLVGLVGYGLKAIEAAGLAFNEAIAQGIAIVPVVLFVTFVVHRIRHKITGADGQHDI